MSQAEKVRMYINTINQKEGIIDKDKEVAMLYLKFLQSKKDFEDKANLSNDMLEEFLLWWIPTNKKYLDFNDTVRYLRSIKNIIKYLQIDNTEEEIVNRLELVDLYGKEMPRVYKNKQIIQKLSGHPVISYKPLIIDFEAYKEYKKKKEKKGYIYQYEKGHYIVDEILKEGVINLRKKEKSVNITTNKVYKIIIRPALTRNFKLGDVLQVTLRKKMFFVYWEIDEIDYYYPKNVLNYI